MDILPVQKLRQLDNLAKELGLSERLLIENASSNLFETINKLGLGKNALVVAGRGNNGADVLSCARKLCSRGYRVKVVALEEKPLGPEGEFQKSLLEKIGMFNEEFKKAITSRLIVILPIHNHLIHHYGNT